MREKIFALVDCNNFYCSCERVFNASVRLRPVIVLSNNDGCVVARTNDIKKYIRMGQPVFECREIIEKYHVAVFSSNYSLYADMSARVMAVLRRFSPLVEIYSIDEAFLDVTEVGTRDFTQLGRAIRARVLQETGIPVPVGFAKSKTLSKIATELVNMCAKTFGREIISREELEEAIANYTARA